MTRYYDNTLRLRFLNSATFVGLYFSFSFKFRDFWSFPFLIEFSGFSKCLLSGESPFRILGSGPLLGFLVLWTKLFTINLCFLGDWLNTFFQVLLLFLKKMENRFRDSIILLRASLNIISAKSDSSLVLLGTPLRASKFELESEESSKGKLFLRWHDYRVYHFIIWR